MPSDAPAWSLHSRLKEDTIDIGDLPLCRVLVIKDAHYPWLLLVPRREGVVEIIDLAEVEQAQLMTEISRVARALKEVTPYRNCMSTSSRAVPRTSPGRARSGV